MYDVANSKVLPSSRLSLRRYVQILQEKLMSCLHSEAILRTRGLIFRTESGSASMSLNRRARLVEADASGRLEGNA